MNGEADSAWQAALDVIGKLRAAGHTALLAGGCVRDMLLSRAPKDYDVATDAAPRRVREIFPRARHVGAKFGVMLVRKFGHDIEVATFRTDGTYSDGRHPDEVTFGTQEDDARRRDFTINGLFFDTAEERVIDYVGGRADLEAGVLRTIGDPDDRFAEDHLRMLRAVRFAARLGFSIERATAEAVTRLAPNLRSISAERVWQELEAILTAPTRTTAWALLVRLGLHEHLSPEWRPDPRCRGVIERRLAALPHRTIRPSPALASVLCDRSPREAAGVCRALRLSNRLTDAVVWLVESLTAVRDESILELADLKLLMAGAVWAELPVLLKAELIATGADSGPYDRLMRRAEAIAPDEIAPPPLLSGDDLIAMGVKAGPRFGEILDAVYRLQLNEGITTRDQARVAAGKLAKE